MFAKCVILLSLVIVWASDKKVTTLQISEPAWSVLITAVDGAVELRGGLVGKHFLGRPGNWGSGSQHPHTCQVSRATCDLGLWRQRISGVSALSELAIPSSSGFQLATLIYGLRVIEANLWTPHMYARTPAHTQVSTHVRIKTTHTQTHTHRELFFLTQGECSLRSWKVAT